MHAVFPANKGNNDPTIWCCASMKYWNACPLGNTSRNTLVQLSNSHGHSADHYCFSLPWGVNDCREQKQTYCNTFICDEDPDRLRWRATTMFSQISKRTTIYKHRILNRCWETPQNILKFIAVLILDFVWPPPTDRCTFNVNGAIQRTKTTTLHTSRKCHTFACNEASNQFATYN